MVSTSQVASFDDRWHAVFSWLMPPLLLLCSLSPVLSMPMAVLPLQWKNSHRQDASICLEQRKVLASSDVAKLPTIARSSHYRSSHEVDLQSSMWLATAQGFRLHEDMGLGQPRCYSSLGFRVHKGCKVKVFEHCATLKHAHGMRTALPKP